MVSAVIENVFEDKCVSHGLPLESGVLTGPPSLNGIHPASELPNN